MRLTDNRALSVACDHAQSVTVVFVLDKVILDQLKDRDDSRVNFIHSTLTELDTDLRSRGSRLVVLHGDPIECIPAYALKVGAEGVFASHDFDPYALDRDREVKRRLKDSRIDFHTCKDHVIFQKSEVLNQSGLPFRVYTPYSKQWRSQFLASDHAGVYDYDPSRLSRVDDIASDNVLESIDTYGFQSNSPWLEPGERAAKARLRSFTEKIDAYGDQRDFPAMEATSTLSVDLRFGTISVREVVRFALERTSKGADKWLAEVIWRDFYHDILGNFPHVASSTFNPTYQDLDWPGSEEAYDAWEAGQTGYPLVDAAMRCLNQTGWMHNRNRMVVASFLSKDLLVDYRRGEAHFARKLLDFDLASNNGGWQWAASVGVDAQPYFRIFNPYLQSQKFDPTGEFIRRWVPELAHLSDKEIHQPGPIDCVASGYPLPIVEHHEVKARAIEFFTLKK